MKKLHQIVWFTICLSTLLPGKIRAAEDAFFFRIVSTQQTHIADFDVSNGRLAWSNETGAACCVEAVSGSITGEWKTVAIINTATNGNLTEITIPNLIPTQPSFTPLLKGSYALGVSIKTNAVFRSLNEWNTFWGVDAPPLEIDFGKDMAILTAMGAKSTGGYGIQINRLNLHLNTMTVSYTETYPRLGDPVTLAFTYPVHLVKTPQNNACVKFEGIIASRPILIWP